MLIYNDTAFNYRQKPVYTMDDRIEKKLKELLPYIIIAGIIFLLLPLFMGKTASAVTYIIEIGVFPLTALICGAVYKVQQKQNSVYLCLIAPLFYALTALLYGMWKSSWVTVLIYIVAYFLCGYLGLILGDVLPLKKKNDASLPSPISPSRVSVDGEGTPVEEFQTEDPTEDERLDTATTENDIEEILDNIHNRK